MAFLARVTPESTFMAYHPLCELLKNQGNQINCTNANIQAAISEQSAEKQALPWTLCSYLCVRGGTVLIAPLVPACFVFCTPSSLSRLASLSWTNLSKGWLGELFSLLSARSATASGPECWPCLQLFQELVINSAGFASCDIVDDVFIAYLRAPSQRTEGL